MSVELNPNIMNFELLRIWQVELRNHLNPGSSTNTYWASNMFSQKWAEPIRTLQKSRTLIQRTRFDPTLTNSTASPNCTFWWFKSSTVLNQLGSNSKTSCLQMMIGVVAECYLTQSSILRLVFIFERFGHTHSLSHFSSNWGAACAASAADAMELLYTLSSSG